MTPPRHEPCECDGDCDGRDPLRCGVAHVLDRLGIDPNCACRAEPGRPLCITCRTTGEIRSERAKSLDRCPLRWFIEAAPPYDRFIHAEALDACASVQIGPDGILEVGLDHEAGARGLTARAAVDPVAFKGARALHDHLRQWVPERIPAELADFEAEVAAGRLRAPRAKGKEPRARRRRDEAVVDLVRDVSDRFGLAPRSGSKPERSACAVVAEAFRLARLQPDSRASVELIWKRRSRPGG